MPTLKQKLEEHKKVFLTKVNDEILSIVGSARAVLADTVSSQKTLSMSDKLPAFSFVGADGSIVKSEQLLASGPLVITFFRGMW